MPFTRRLTTTTQALPSFQTLAASRTQFIAAYQQGGAHFYAIAMPCLELCAALKKEDMTAEYEEMLQCIREHADFMLQTGLAYPPSEVNFEQSIVAPACDLLLQVYELTHEKRYL